MSSTADTSQVRRIAGDLTIEARGCLSALVKLLSRAPSPRPHGTGGRRLRPGAGSQPPVLLVHGLAADRSCFSAMEDQLHRAGYTTLSTSYSCHGADIEECARRLERDAAWLLDQTGSDSVHVVAHSLGGVVLRWAATHTSMRDWVHVAVTLGTPHRGTPVARLAPRTLPHFGRIISQLRPGAFDVADAEVRASGRVRWVTIAAELDWVVPVSYAALPESGNVRNAVVPAGGHMSLTSNPHCLSIILQELTAAGPRYHDARPKALTGERKDLTMTVREPLTDCSCGQPIDPPPTGVPAHCRRCGRVVRRAGLVPAATTPIGLTARQAA